MENFLPKNLQRQINILFYTLGKKDTSAREVSDFFNISRRLVKRTISDINKQFEYYLDKQNYIVSTNFGNTNINVEYEKTALHDVNLMKLLLLKDNIIFRLCILLVTFSSISRKEIKEKLFISDVYLDKLLHKLRKYLNKFDIRIGVSFSHYSLTGNEINIRLFSYVCLSQTFKNLEWPFQDISLEDAIEYIENEDSLEVFRNTEAQKYSLYYMYAIFRTRISSNNKIKQYKTVEEKDILSYICKDYSFNILHMLGCSKSSLTAEGAIIESRYFLFFVLISGSDILCEKDKLELGHYFGNSEHPYCELAGNIMRKKAQFISTDEEEEQFKHAMYIFTMAITASFMMKGTVQNFIRLFSQDHLPYLDINQAKVDKFWSKLPRIIMDEDQEFVIKRILYSAKFLKVSTGVKIFIEITKDISASQHIRLKLKQLFNADTIRITDEIDEADVIVTDTFEKKEVLDKVFYLDSINNQNAWDNLQLHILQQYLAKQHKSKKTDLYLS